MFKISGAFQLILSLCVVFVYFKIEKLCLDFQTLLPHPVIVFVIKLDLESTDLSMHRSLKFRFS